MNELLSEAAQRASNYLDGLKERRVAPSPEDLERLALLDTPLPEKPSDPAEVLGLLDEIGSPATVATRGPRYFGFVIGRHAAGLPGGNWLAGAWDQDVGLRVTSPVGGRARGQSA